MSTDTLESTGTITRTVTEDAAPGDHDLFAHYVRKEQIMASAMDGTPVLALCQKKWIPGRDPQKFQVCPECKDIYENVVGTGKGKGGDKQ